MFVFIVLPLSLVRSLLLLVLLLLLLVLLVLMMLVLLPVTRASYNLPPTSVSTVSFLSAYLSFLRMLFFLLLPLDLRPSWVILQFVSTQR